MDLKIMETAAVLFFSGLGLAVFLVWLEVRPEGIFMRYLSVSIFVSPVVFLAALIHRIWN